MERKAEEETERLEEETFPPEVEEETEVTEDAEA